MTPPKEKMLKNPHKLYPPAREPVGGGKRTLINRARNRRRSVRAHLFGHLVTGRVLLLIKTKQEQTPPRCLAFLGIGY